MVGQLSLDDYTMPIEAVVRVENRPLTGEEMLDKGEYYYSKRPRLRDAHFQAAQLFNDNGKDATAKGQTNFARVVAALGRVASHEMVDIYADALGWERDEVFSIPDATTPYLTRLLESRGYRVTKAKSKLDKENDGTQN